MRIEGMTEDPLEEIRQRFASRPQGELKREDFTPERIAGYAKLVAQAGLGYSFISEDDREANRAAFLSEHPPGTDLWVFGYGSLMWNPAIETAGAQAARISGFHRSFCLTLAFGRATPDRPGLMLVLLDGGDVCAGVAHRIAADKVDSETRILWLREMLSGAYRPVWTDITFADATRARGLTFVANAGHPRLETGLDLDTTAHRIAAAEGERGANRDYLFQCAEALANHGLTDDLIARLDARVRAILAEQTASS
jgi:glutathione-specific gamma-glutamylcyclotransferase